MNNRERGARRIVLEFPVTISDSPPGSMADFDGEEQARLSAWESSDAVFVALTEPHEGLKSRRGRTCVEGYVVD